jgi:prepilin-type processing-associated H-X9-DG protein
MREGRGLRLIDVFGLLFCVAILGGVLMYYFRPGDRRPSGPARKVHCRSNLRQIGTAMATYLNTLGRNSFYSVPAHAFRGDAWLVSLYWSGIFQEPKLFCCPSTDDDYTRIPATRAAAGDLTRAEAIPSGAISYAGRCRGTSFTHRNTTSFMESGLPSASAMACDDNEGTPNHEDGINVVFFDTHVDFIEGADYATIGAPGSDYQYLDSGE